MDWTIGVDVGGTFTDIHAVSQTGQVLRHKTPSTPDDPARAILAGTQALCRQHDIDPATLRRLAHGTTVATNALIQRRGARVALVVTAGFRDLIEIGRQIRPHLYDLQRDQPEALVPRPLRFELHERLSANGTPLRTPTPEHLNHLAAEILATHPEAVAICLLFAFLDPTHERQMRDALQALAPDLPISLSSDVQPEFREYERLSTTVLNAYLQPTMSRYLGALAAGITTTSPNAEVGINQSSGGLMSVARAQRIPIRTALSGPAAGVMGAVDAARAAGLQDVITLDMGGTSADVSLIRALQPGLAFERAIEGFPVRLPCLDINAVGAGGGSIAWFDRDGLLKVGPQSAGAAPGPACYAQGGHDATVTDANLLLGRLSPAGLLAGAMPLDPEAARAAIAPLAHRLGFTPERTAHGILGLVVSTMVRAIRAVSVERGIDPRTFTLLAFGGAGPLHAAAVARALGMRQVMIPPAPGILCAQGLIVSDISESFVRTVRLRLEDETLPRAIAALQAEAATWFAHEAIPPEHQAPAITLDMRYVGQNFEIPVEAGDDLRARFHAAHERAYGYFTASDPIEVVNIRLLATARLPRTPEPPPNPTPSSPTTRPVWFDPEAPIETPVHHRPALHPGAIIQGPAIIEQLDATTIIPPGATAQIHPSGALIIEISPESTSSPAPESTSSPAPESTSSPAPESTSSPPPESTSSPAPESTSSPAPESTSSPGLTRGPRAANAPHEPTPDPIQLEIIHNAIRSVTDETYVALMRSAYSTNIKERHDHSTAVMDRNGHLIAQADMSFPTHLGSIMETMQAVLTKYGTDIHPGDVFIANDPHVAGGTHLPDVNLIQPVFHNGHLFAFLATIAHHADMGGMSPGSMSGGMTEIYQEGLRIPVMRLFRQGQLQTETFDLILLNVRVPEERRGDWNAQIAACRLGERRLQELAQAVGLPTLEATFADIIARTRARMAAAIATIPDGDYAFDDLMDDDGLGTQDIPVRVRIHKHGETIRLDFSESGNQVRGNINSVFNASRSSACYVLKAMLDPEIPNNQGVHDAAEILCQPGRIMNATFPAAVAARNHVCQRIVDVVIGALAPAIPLQAVAAANGSNTSTVFSGIDPRTARPYVYFETLGGGFGGRATKDGRDGVQVHITNTSNLPVEAIEMDFPLHVEQYAFVEDSAGPGQFRGGLGLRRIVRPVAHTCDFNGVGERFRHQPWGLFGGGPGASGRFLLRDDTGHEHPLPGKTATQPIRPDQVLIVETPGAGGYGPPTARSQEARAEDQASGKFSPAHRARYPLPSPLPLREGSGVGRGRAPKPAVD